MVIVLRATIQWMVLPRARAVFAEVREALGADAYERDKLRLQDFLCAYFGHGNCMDRQGNSIAPMKSTATARGGKCLKVRWATPGTGKSGGLRLAVVAYCDKRVVKIAGAWHRRDDLSDSDFFSATADG